MTKLQNVSKAYANWLQGRPAPAVQLMKGLSSSSETLALDATGLASRGWTDLPVTFEPEQDDVLMGGYMEDRSIYDSPVFKSGSDEPRTLHVGLDVFAKAETPVFAPLQGWVHSFRINAGPLDYGPTIVLQHEPAPDLVFWTLYGHLTEDSLMGLDEGDPIAAGEKLAELGQPEINGGWAPHLHFQIILDIGSHHGDFPGVCKPAERDHWAQLCPDPRDLLGLN